MSVADYKSALLQAIQSYETQKGKRLSKRRKNDILELREILQKETDPHQLQSALLERIAKIKTGWWIFKLFGSQLKRNLFHVIHHPNYAIDKMVIEEIQLQQEALIKNRLQERQNHQQIIDTLQAESNKLDRLIEKQQATLQELECQLQLKYQQLEGRKYYIQYEDYLINLLDKFMNRSLLRVEEVKLLSETLDNMQLNLKNIASDIYSHHAFIDKINEACRFALNVLNSGADYLITGEVLDVTAFECIAKFTGFYCFILKNNPELHAKLHSQINKLLMSYYKDGAGKTVIDRLSSSDKQIVFGLKEMMINSWGAPSQSEAIVEPSNLRRALRWEDFKKICLEKGKLLHQWFLEKKRQLSPTKKAGNNPLKLPALHR